MRAFVSQLSLVFAPTLMVATFASLGWSGEGRPQNAKATGPSAPRIADEPKTIDPATLVPKKLATPATVQFTETPLREVARWVEETLKLPVLFDQSALSKAGIALGEPVTDHLSEEPVYLLLNRLRTLGLAWYVEDEVLYITMISLAEARMTTETYNVGDLLDAGYEPDALIETILSATEGPWSEINGDGGEVQWLGDVLFVRHCDTVQREVAGLLAALRKHGRQTFVLEPPQHLALRAKLKERVSVTFQDTPLRRAVQELASKTGIDIRLDEPALREKGVRDRELVSLRLSDRKLSTVLRVLLADLDLTWLLQDGVLWITTDDRADDTLKTAVYDVRDLCRNEEERDAFQEAVQMQTNGPWEDLDGVGGTIAVPRVGTMVVRQTERGLQEVADLLEMYRKALLASKPRKFRGASPDEVVVRYYRMYKSVAEDLARVLPQLVKPESWKSERHPEAPGEILVATSAPEFVGAEGHPVSAGANDKNKANSPAFILPQAVLIIRQTRAVHERIVEVIRRVEQGDPAGELSPDGFGGGGFGGAYFGGGFFQIK